jgi:hypothetical protein
MAVVAIFKYQVKPGHPDDAAADRIELLNKIERRP